MPKLYIALATYNGEKYLPWMLDSLLLQTRPADKVFAVDDGSTDGTVAILESYKNRLPLDIHPQKENRGHRAAFNLALELVQKEAAPEDFIALADKDDVWLPEKLKILSEKIGNADLVFGDAEVIGKDGEKIAGSWRALANISTQNTILEQVAGTNNVTGCTSLFRASLLSKALPIPEGISVHDRWIAMLAQKNKRDKAISDKVIQYRIHDCNAVGLGNKLSFSNSLKEQGLWLAAILKNTERLSLSDAEIQFCKEFAALIERRQTQGISFSRLPWIFKNRNILFPNTHGKALIQKILFTAVGTPVATRFFGKQ